MTAASVPGRGTVPASALGVPAAPGDAAVIAALIGLRFATSQQLRRLVEPAASDRSWQRRLRRLTRSGLLRRVERRVGGITAGSAPWSYTLGPAVARPLGTRPGSLPGRAYQRHRLLTAEAVVRAVEAVGQRPGWTLDYRVEAAAWEAVPSGTVKPDAALTLRGPGVEERYAVELDTGSQSLPAIRRKLDAYEQLYRSGTVQARDGLFPLIVFVALDQVRAQALATVVARRRLPLYATTTLDAWPTWLVSPPEERPPPSYPQIEAQARPSRGYR
jgi:hypothetical protein